jgi:hypothetical protein
MPISPVSFFLFVNLWAGFFVSIAAKLRRTEESIRARANFLGLSADRRTEVANSKQK